MRIGAMSEANALCPVRSALGLAFVASTYSRSIVFRGADGAKRVLSHAGSNHSDVSADGAVVYDQRLPVGGIGIAYRGWADSESRLVTVASGLTGYQFRRDQRGPGGQAGGQWRMTLEARAPAPPPGVLQRSGERFGIGKALGGTSLRLSWPAGPLRERPAGPRRSGADRPQRQMKNWRCRWRRRSLIWKACSGGRRDSESQAPSPSCRFTGTCFRRDNSSHVRVSASSFRSWRRGRGLTSIRHLRSTRMRAGVFHLLRM